MLHHRDVVCNPTTASIPGYVLYTRNRSDKDGNITTRSGGVGVYIKEDVEHNILKLNEHMHIHELLWVKVKPKKCHELFHHLFLESCTFHHVLTTLNP